MSLRKPNPVLLLALSIAVSCLGGALLVAFHAPLRNEVRSSWLNSQPAERRTIFHFATEKCRCSDQLISHLLARPLAEGSHEVLVYVGAVRPALDALRAKGYEVRLESSIEQTGVLAAPWLLVRGAGGRVIYSGGYEAAPYWEARILYNTEHRMLQASLPTTGCSTSKSLRRQSFALWLKEWIFLP